MTYKFDTLQVHAGQEQADPATGARSVPIYLTSSYVFNNAEQATNRFNLSDPGNIYSRLTNPTVEVFEKRMAALEGGVAALATSSGLAAVNYAVIALAHAGQNIVAAQNLYGGTFELFHDTLPNYGITTTFVEPNDYEGFEKAIDDNTRALYAETLGNPNCDPVDIEKLAEIAHRHGIPLIIDATFTPPSVIRPIEYGADIVVHSATKFISGHGTGLGGVITDSGKFDWKASGKFPALTEPNASYNNVVFADACGPAAFVNMIRAIILRDTGSCLSPFHAFLFILGLETLSLRLRKHTENALKVAAFLNSHPKVENVNHPSVTRDPEQQAIYKKYYPEGAGSIFTFEIKGGIKEAQTVIDNLKLFSLLANVGDAKSLAIHPATTTHAQLSGEELLKHGIKPNTIRVSIGIEDADDIIQDLDQALSKI